MDMRSATALPRVLLWALCAALCTLLPLAATAAETGSGTGGDREAAPRVQIDTSLGSFEVELWPAQAPRTVASFLRYVDRSFYDGLVFHRVIPDFMIQTGGYDADFEFREPAGRVPNESVGGPRNARGTLAMARQRHPDSADAQFFVNVAANTHLDADGSRPGYTVFGRVTRGMDVVDRIAMVETGVRNGMRDVPLEHIVIESVRRVPAGEG